MLENGEIEHPMFHFEEILLIAQNLKNQRAVSAVK